MIPAAKPFIGAEERAAVERVMLTGMLAQGPEVSAFETDFSEFVNGIECVAVNSGTSALHLSLLAAGIGPGDEVIVPSFTFAGTANAVALTGAEPVFADIEIDTFNLDPSSVMHSISSRTKAIMPVHLYGHPADLVALSKIASDKNLLLIEDAAQAHAASVNDVPVGAWGAAGSFSFYPTKNVTSGEGGIVATSSPDLARSVRILRNQGMEVRYQNEKVGFNNRMTDVHAAIGRVQLTRLREWTQQRQSNAAFFDAELAGVVTPKTAQGAVHVYHQYTIRIEGLDRDKFAEELAKHGVGTGVYYPTPVHRLPSFSRKEELPVTERAAKEALSIPVYPSLTEGELEKIVEAVNSVARAGS